jgi:uncharacterized protein (DUF4415 family)
MKKGGKGNNSEFTDKMKEMGWREIKREDRPAITLKPENKSRITIYLDTDIVESFKQSATENKIGYQTLINRALRNVVKTQKVLPEQLKESLLKDEQFLQNLKSALAL